MLLFLFYRIPLKTENVYLKNVNSKIIIFKIQKKNDTNVKYSELKGNLPNGIKTNPHWNIIFDKGLFSSQQK
jgi:hypothetical protein